MKNLFLLCLGFILLSPVYAQIDGPRSASSFTTVVIPGSNKTWLNTGNAAASDNSYSNFGNLTGGVGSYTDYLVATNFGFSIPLGVTVSGIVAEVERSDPNSRTSDYRVRIVKGGVIGSTERSGGAAYGSTDSYQLYGNAGDLWGETWTSTDINTPNFGLAIAAQRSVSGGTTAGQIDHIRITVYYDFFTLPVRLSSFTAVKLGQDVLVSWQTTDESNMQQYVVERSRNGRDFSAIHSRQSLNQAGSLQYSFTDTDPLPGNSWYRIKMVGNNGEVKHSSLALIQFENNAKADLYPTLLSPGQMLNIRNQSNEKLTVIFYSPSGQKLSTVQTLSTSFSSIMLFGQKGLVIYQVFNEEGIMKGRGRLMIQ
ncbi:MAG TPA: hypothetical protein VFX58_11685 [Chitinophagaceae bacterium]|nr:hypothetical protein [Chitinophagaceae bacterium]